MPIVVYNYIGDRVLERLYPQNGTRMTYLDNTGTVDVGYDGLGRPVELRHLRSDDSLIVGFQYGYDRMNNKLFEDKLHAANDSELYGYDSAYRLVSFERGTLNAAHDTIVVASVHVPTQTTWDLDGTGNWTEVDGETRDHNGFNQIVEQSTKRAISPEYWAVRGPAHGRELHHWLIPQRWTNIPEGVRNARFNLLEMPAWPTIKGLNLNRWMGFTTRWSWGNFWHHKIAATSLENAIRLGIPGSLIGGGYLGYVIADWLTSE